MIYLGFLSVSQSDNQTLTASSADIVIYIGFPTRRIYTAWNYTNYKAKCVFSMDILRR